MKESPATWKKGLIHLHSTFSDGVHTIPELKALAEEHGFDYMIVTDHLEHPRMRGNLGRYIAACSAVSEPGIFMAIPGLEIATPWRLRGDVDSSTAHTLAFDITAHEVLFKSSPPAPSTAELIETLTSAGLAALPAHPFQYTPLSASFNAASGSDYRYDMAAMPGAPAVDFFYRSIMDENHEPEDLALYTGLLARWVAKGGPGASLPMPIAYSGSDYHLGAAEPPGSIRERLAPEILTRLLSSTMTDIMTIPAEQLSHTTWTCLDGPLTAENIVEAIKKGRTCATRGRSHMVSTLDMKPCPGITDAAIPKMKTPEISAHVTFTSPTTRPLFAAIYRDGAEISGFTRTFRKGLKIISLTFRDESAPPGIHAYAVVLAGKLVTSPVLVEKR